MSHRPLFQGRRRLSTFQRRSRQNSVSTLDATALVDDNTSEMFSGVASGVIPSSVSSFHYAHHFARRPSQGEPLDDALPLLAAASRPAYGASAPDLDLRSVASAVSAVLTESAQGNFRFFTSDEIEAAPGGLTLQTPAFAVDYNTHWDYPVDKLGDADGTLQPDGRARLPPAGGATLNGPGALDRLSRASGPAGDADDDARSVYEDRFRRRSSVASSKSSASASAASARASLEEAAFVKDYAPVACYQRYYLAEEDIVVGIAGYSACLWKTVLYYALCVCTLGVGYVVLRWLPRYRVNLKGTPCPLGRADWCVVENEYGELTMAEVTRARFGDRLSSFLTVALKLENDGLDASSAKDHNPVVPYVHSFEYRYLKFFYSPVDDMFRTNSNWYDLHWLSVKHLREGTAQSLQEQRADIFGKNNISIREKSALQLLADEVLHPFYIFQVFSILLWLADDYYYYASCIFIISLVSIINTLIETKTTIARLKQMSLFNCDIRVWRHGFWTQTDSDNLVPGDVFEVDPSLAIIPCDALLINGECVVNESMLTGESVPVTKSPATNDTVQHLAENFTSSVLTRSFLYNGTKLLKMKTSNDEPVLATVVKTGFNTTKGSLVRSMLFPKPAGFKFYEDSFKYIGFMTIVAFFGFIYSTYNFIQIGLPKRIMILRALDIITIVVPPALPATLTIGTSFAVTRLKQKLIFCISPTRINIGGKIDVACFDKTGTLTEDGLDVLGVHPTKSADGRKEIVFEHLISSIDQLSHQHAEGHENNIQSKNLLLGCMASCHSLRLIDNGLLGDPLDVKMFEFTGWNFIEEFGGLPFPLVYDSVGKETFGYKILKEFEFVAALRRMSVLVERNGNNYIFTKGAPEVMLDICDPTTIPSEYEELLHKYTHGGYRVIACASKPLAKGKHKNPDRLDAEKNLSFSGFIIFENKLKSSTKGTLKQLRDAKIRSVMCTGDNVLTAVSVGRECELIDPLVTQVYIPRFASDEEVLSSGDTGLIWEDMHNPLNKLDPTSLQRVTSDIRDDVHEYILAITGDIFRYILVELQRPYLTDMLLMKCNVFARMSPDEKHELVEQLRKLDYTVAFCGDGANDCGALKAADVGISLSEAEASVAASFTLKIFEISCVLDVIREGRSSLVTSFSCFKYMSLYSAIQFMTVSLLYRRGSNLGDFQFLYIDLFLILPLAIFMSWSKPFEKLVVKRPTANLVSPKVLIPLLCHIFIIAMFQISVWLYVQEQPWYIKPVPSETDSDVKSSDNTVLFLFTNMQYILNAVVLSTGPPYREPIINNKPFLLNLVCAFGMSTLLFKIDQDTWWGNFMQLTNMSLEAYFLILVAAFMNLTLLYQGEQRVFQKFAWIYKRLFHRHRKSKKSFKNLTNDFRLTV
ncbi:hypothetical protein METBIDRAFT_12805 [Metschnikowia bicuspidata var. bicuspidata NRRL YB-4993]|uniref:Cation-transporting ATPase n=1 Tax=Metschnikowia bicuspidata var. bicuspidata NRRL YB-4993 TaxID=869754 RepID=A0A1A0H779_9ASCO|nr:hypothetical protein METBIDRAFT_12805 [Metschnikowia bicuspidata var. bicuspidata NRRL YB-4993]OBA19758.1 hypothetical protein METBIDRAFT_12805 [Metschnikowia bicuspidata var. bicuspidata NRRL YB-4993]